MMDGQFASFSWRHAPIWDLQPIFHLLSLIIFRQLMGLLLWGPSLMRSWVCTFQLLMGIASAVFCV
jgi:hypothetical protein